jgi:hypothetical protein
VEYALECAPITAEHDRITFAVCDRAVASQARIRLIRAKRVSRVRASYERRHVPALLALSPDHNSPAGQAARKRRAAQTDFVRRRWLRCSYMLYRPQSGRPGGRKAASVIAEFHERQRAHVAWPAMPAEGRRTEGRGGGGIFRKNRPSTEATNVSPNVSAVSDRAVASQARSASLERRHVSALHTVTKIPSYVRTKRRGSAAPRKPSCYLP